MNIPNLISRLALRWLDYRTRITLEKHVGAAEPVAIKSIEATPDYTSILARHPLFADLARSVAEVYDEIGGPNFVEMKLAGPLGAYLVTVAPLKPGVKTQGDVAAELKERVADCEGQIASLQEMLAKAQSNTDMNRDNWTALYIILRDLLTWVDDAFTHGHVTVPVDDPARWHRPITFARNALEACPHLAKALDEHTDMAQLRVTRAEAEATAARQEAAEAREQAERDRAMWFSIARRAARRARQKERDRCAAIAQDLDCEEPPDGYLISDPELDPYMPGWEKGQCYHGDRIAALILGQEDVRS